MKQLVVINNNQIVVSSKDLAEHFGKAHKDVLENIRNILVAENSATKFYQLKIQPMNFIGSKLSHQILV